MIETGETEEIYVVILLLADTKAMLLAQVNNNNRLKETPSKLLLTASSDSDAGNTTDMPTKAHDDLESQSFQLSQKSVQSIFEKKMNELKSTLSNTETPTQNTKETILLKRTNSLSTPIGPSSKQLKITNENNLRKTLKIVKNEKVHSIEQCKKEVEDLKTKINDLNKKLNEAIAEKETIKKMKESYKKKYQEKEAEYDVLLKLNRDFQVTMIEKTKETHEMFERLAAFQEQVPLGCAFPAIGTLRTSDNMRKYHIGHDVWISENEYTGLLNSSKSPSQLAGNITTLVFAMDELLTSTRTGFKTRSGGVGKESCGKLDPVKLAACETFYKYWLQNMYTSLSKNDAKNLHVDMLRYNYYAGKKIADLKKPPTQKKASKQKVTITKNKSNKEKHKTKNSDEEEDSENKQENESLPNDRKSYGRDDEDNISNNEDDEYVSDIEKEIERDRVKEGEKDSLRLDPLFIDVNNKFNDETYLDYAPTLSPASSLTSIQELHK